MKITKLIRIKENSKNPLYYYKIGGKEHLFHVVKKIGSDSVNGVVYKVCNKNKCNALKVLSIPLKWENKRAIGCPDYLERELRFLMLCNKLVKEKVSNNLPLTLSFYDATDSACYLNPNDFTGKCLMFQAPLADGDGNNWIQTKKSTKQIISFILQVLLGLYVFRSQLNAFHQDLHLGNVLFYKEPLKTYYYKFQGRTLALPNYQTRFSLWDFDTSVSYDFCKITEKISETTDYTRFLDVVMYYLHEQIGQKNLVDKLTNILDYSVDRNYSIQQLIFLIVSRFNIGTFVDKCPKSKNVFNLDKKLNLFSKRK